MFPRNFLLLLLSANPVLRAADSLPDLTDFRAVAAAKTTAIVQARAATGGGPGYLGVEFAGDDAAGPVIAKIESASPAQDAGLQPGDAILQIGDVAVLNARTLRETIQSLGEGAATSLRLTRGDKALDLPVKLGAASRPKTLPEKQPILGLRLSERTDGEGLVAKTVLDNSPHARAGMKSGDILVKIDGSPIRTPFDISIALADQKPGDKVKLTVLRDGKEIDIEFALLAAADSDLGVAPAKNYWKKDSFKLAVICVEFADIEHQPAVAATDWTEAIFSQGTYHDKKSATGQPVFGSVNDFYRENSAGAFHLEGRVFDWVRVAKKRDEYNQGTNPIAKAVLLNEAMDLVLARDGKDAFQGTDGFFFIYAGERFPTTNRGSLYWPHRATFQRKVAGKDLRVSYFICPEGGKTMTSISLFCHEFGHMLGLPDLYARPENPGSEGAGVWCLMSSELPKGRPQHLSAWCKEKLGWLKPAVLDPADRQNLILSPVEGSTTECFKVLVRRDASEYFLLENRQQRDFDTGLPAAGLLVWRVVGNHPILEESHGIEGPLGPRVFLNSIPFPSASGHAFTPDTRPSSHSLLGGGLQVHINEIRQLPDGRITFTIGHSYQ